METNTTYSLKEKRNMSRQINQLKSKDAYIDVYRIIYNNNPDINVNETGGETILHFHDLTSKTYDLLLEYLGKASITQHVPTQAWIFNSSSTEQIDQKQKYTTKEKSMIKQMNINSLATF